MPPETPPSAAPGAQSIAGTHGPLPSRRRLAVIGLLLAAGAAAVVVSGMATRRSEAARLTERAAAQAVRPVHVISPAAAGTGAPLELPGRLEAWSRAPIYARVSGYLKRWTADIGTRVRAGQVLAEIETPELDQQLQQAQAELANARANAALSEATARRWQELLASGMVARQVVDEKTGDLAAKQAAVRAMQANVERIQALKGFARVLAPFDGVVTARNTDVGALINAGGTPGSELFVVSDVSKLRVYVTVPQTLVALAKAGTEARVAVPERPGARHAATVQSAAQAINSASGGMLVQLAVDNRAGELLPGGFAQVAFERTGGGGVLSVPPSTLIFGKAGLRVAVVDVEGKARLKPVKVARDLGSAVEIADGLKPDDRVIESPPDGLDDGDAVSVAPRPAAPR
ncbi:MAG: efflux RND transporter periplasmic adaptor subunit [Rubrivivax sp.]